MIPLVADISPDAKAMFADAITTTAYIAAAICSSWR